MTISKDTFPTDIYDLPDFIKGKLVAYKCLYLKDMSVVKREVDHRLNWMLSQAVKSGLLKEIPEVYLIEYKDSFNNNCLMVDIDHYIFSESILL